MSLVMRVGRSVALATGVAILAFAPTNLSAQVAQGGIGATQKAEPPLKLAGTPTTATEIVAGQNQMPMVQSNGEQLLKEYAARYRNIVASGGFAQVPAFAMKKGDKSPNVATLNTRLFQEGYLQVEGTQGQFADVFTSATQDAVARFQRNHGLAVTGKLDAGTVAEFNVPADKRLATIDANIPRLAVYQEGLGDRYLLVNVPAQQLEAVSGGRVSERHNTIVGRPARPTPVVMTGIETVKFNPYWNSPASIARKDILPKLQNDLTYLSKTDIKIFKMGPNGADGDPIDPKSLDFKNLVVEDYLFRQEPGPENAMATAKIEFKSPFGIYLHDTPEKQMFNYNNRFFSSGCIRIQNMPGLLNWVLNGQDGYNPDKIAGMAKTLERLDVKLNAPLQLRVAYLTAWPAAGGTVAFRNDIYQMDGSGFIVGQPMAVGELSPDSKRFVLKPLPRALPIDAAEAEGSGFFGFKGGKVAGGAKPAVAGAGNKATGNIISANATTPVAANSGFFDWPSYYKKKAAEEKAAAAAAKDPKKKLKKKSAKASDAKAKDAKVADAKPADTKAAAKATKLKKTTKAKVLDCKPGTSGAAPDTCKTKPAKPAKPVKPKADPVPPEPN